MPVSLALQVLPRLSVGGSTRGSGGCVRVWEAAPVAQVAVRNVGGGTCEVAQVAVSECGRRHPWLRRLFWSVGVGTCEVAKVALSCHPYGRPRWSCQLPISVQPWPWQILDQCISREEFSLPFPFSFYVFFSLPFSLTLLSISPSWINFNYHKSRKHKWWTEGQSWCW